MTSFAVTSYSATKQRRRRRPNRPLRRRQPKPKKETPATFSRADSVVPRTTDSIDSYAVPSGTRSALCLYSRWRETACENSRRKAYRSQAYRGYACALPPLFFLVIVHFEMPFRSLHGHHILRAGVGGNHETLSPALYMERQQTRRMACGIYGGNTGHDLVARFDEG